MNVIHTIRMDFARRRNCPGIEVVQGDSLTRVLEISLYENGAAWEVPDGASVLLRYRKPDGTGGTYDTLPDGTTAWSADGNVVRFTLAPQVLTCPGLVRAQLEIVKGDASVGSFTFQILVERDLLLGALRSENYISLSAWINETLNARLTELVESGEFVGPAGADGQDGYTPQKGVDYWTDEDKNEIAEAVEAVRCTEQDLTDEQKAQARENIGFEAAALNLMIALGIAPVLLDADGAVLTDGDGAILLNT